MTMITFRMSAFLCGGRRPEHTAGKHYLIPEVIIKQALVDSDVGDVIILTYTFFGIHHKL